ncbi:MAG TPA: hypothetical protein ENJ60_14095 [Aeromonadales bacterium]|nr:hypothetical protein [Aeromonadales bacterium]
MWKVTKKDWEFFNTIISILSSSIITALAVWAALFTSLPERLLETYNTEINLAKSEIIKLRSERIKNNEFIAKANLEIKNLDSLNKALKNESNNLSSELEKIQKQLSLAKKEEAITLSQEYNSLVKDYLLSVENVLKDKRERALFLADFQETKKWIKSEPPLPKFNYPQVSRSNSKEYLEAYSKAQLNYKKAFVEHDLVWDKWFKSEKTTYAMWFSLTKNYDMTKISSYYKAMNDDFVDAKRILFSNLLIEKLNDLLKIRSKDTSKKNLLRLRKMVHDFIMKHSKEIAFNLDPLLLRGFTDNDILKSGNDALHSIEKANVLLNKFSIVSIREPSFN